MNRGLSIIEVLIAMALAVMVISGAVSASGGFGLTISDSEIGAEAMRQSQDLTEQINAESRGEYPANASSTAIECRDGFCYQKRVATPVAYAAQCSEVVTVSVSWAGAYGRMLSVDATTTVVDVPQMFALGGGCDMSPPIGEWDPPALFASSNFDTGKPTGIDVFQGSVYMTGDHAPYLFIASTTYATLGQNSGLFVNTGTFDAGVQLNDIRVARINGSVYAFVAANSSTKQLRVIDVTDINDPVLVASSTLANVSGSFPEGFRVYYYDTRLYITTRETAGSEFHIFDVSTPSAPVELGNGYAINRTVESMVITKKLYAGSDHYYAYLATDKNAAELTVLDITNPAAIAEIIFADQNVPGNQDGASVYLRGDDLYLGRLSGGASELFVFDAKTPWNGLRMIGQQNIGAGVIGLAVSGRFAFLSTTKAHQGFQVYDSDPDALTGAHTVSDVPGPVANGIRYSNNRVYIASRTDDALRIFY
ncbi:hypothetical protein HZC00_03080 [Candidatus Kaiserbacteria bacterium]|nr:hypothetical protein [Candidatus Kaiserbacteria bacterium]